MHKGGCLHDIDMEESTGAEVMSDRIEIFELIERLDAASRDETLADGMLYRAAAKRLAEYISRDVKYWHSIMSRTDKQADRIAELEEQKAAAYKEVEIQCRRLEAVKALPHDSLCASLIGDSCDCWKSKLDKALKVDDVS